MTERAFEGSYPIFFTNSSELFPNWWWADNKEPFFYAVLKPVTPNPLLKDVQRYECMVVYGGSEGGMRKFMGTSFRPITKDRCCVYGVIHPELGKVIHDKDLNGLGIEINPSQIEKITCEDEGLKKFFEEARKIVAS